MTDVILHENAQPANATNGLYDLNTAGKQHSEGERRPIDWDALDHALKALAECWPPYVFPNGRRVDDKWRMADITGRAPKTRGSCIIHLDGENAGDWYDYEFGKG